MADPDDEPIPPPGGYLRDPGPAGPAEAQQAALERIADALEALGRDIAEMRRVLNDLLPGATAPGTSRRERE